LPELHVIDTAIDLGCSDPALRCPGCLRYLPLEESWIGREITCPEEGCAARMRIDPSLARLLRKGWRRFWRRIPPILEPLVRPEPVMRPPRPRRRDRPRF
jgi:hypothetical protein